MIKKPDKKDEQIKTLTEQIIELKQKYLWAKADYQNLEKRIEKEKFEWIKFSNTALLLRILDVADDLDRAAKFINDAGLNMVRDHLTQILKEQTIKETEALGKEFDPNLMECIDHREGMDNVVLEVQAKGYLYHDRVLRPAKVVVGKSKK